MSPGRALPWLLAAALLGCTAPDRPTVVSGQVLWQERGVPMALVEAYATPAQDTGVPPLAEIPSGEDGLFQLELPPGTYWLWARATLEGEANPRRGVGETRLVGQAHENPLHLREGDQLTARIDLADPSGFSAAAGPSGTGVTGSVGGAPAPQVTVYAYPGETARPTGPSFLAAAPPDAAGRFRLDLPPGTYTIAARWRASGRDYGALQVQDRTARATATVTSGEYTEISPLELHPIDAGVRDGTPIGSTASDTVLRGRVVDGQGKPRAGIHLLAFRDSRMAGKPDALGAPTGKDGSFQLFLPAGGVYFLGARSRLGGPAQPGEWNGAFRGAEGEGLRVDSGARIDDVVIVVEEVW